jgi:hypothetical protein
MAGPGRFPDQPKRGLDDVAHVGIRIRAVRRHRRADGGAGGDGGIADAVALTASSA